LALDMRGLGQWGFERVGAVLDSKE